MHRAHTVYTKEQEATWAEKKAMALHLEVMALYQEMQASIIQEEICTLTHQLAHQEEVEAGIQGEARDHLPCCQPYHHKGVQMEA